MTSPKCPLKAVLIINNDRVIKIDENEYETILQYLKLQIYSSENEKKEEEKQTRTYL